MLKLESRMLETIRLHGMLNAGEKVLVAVSGGPDSVALLLTLLDLAHRLGVRIAAAHVNHRLRGAESEADEAFVRDLCAKLGVPLKVCRLKRRQRSAGANLEQQLRRRRYAVLFALAGPQKAKVATGHTLDDQAETFLMKAARGAGPTGLGGIFPVRRNVLRRGGKRFPVTVIRPLVECTREQVLRELERRSQPWRSDSSNQDLSLDRNWVRHCLLPLLRERLNPKVLENIGRNAALCREASRYLRRQGRKALRKCLVAQSPEVALSVAALRQLPEVLQRETVRLALVRARGNLSRISRRNVRDLLGLVNSASGRSIDLAGGWRAWREFGHLRFSQAAESDFEMELSIPGDLFVQETGKRIRARPADAGQEQKAKAAVRLRRSGTPGRLLVRNRRPGDRIWLEGRERKLKELFQKRRIPAGKRGRLLVLEWNGQVAWVEEIGVDSRFQEIVSGGEMVEIEVSDETFDGGSVSKYGEGGQ